MFAANDELTFGVMAACHRADREVGRDFAFVGHNNVPMAARMPVPLNSVRTNFEQIANPASARDFDASKLARGLKRPPVGASERSGARERMCHIPEVRSDSPAPPDPIPTERDGI